MSVKTGFLLVDSSAWIDVLRNQASTPLRKAVEIALHEQRAAMTEPVWLELYRGVKGKRELEQLQELRELCHWLTFDEGCWQTASEISRKCRERGVAVPLGDVLIFACSQRHSAELLEADKHFEMIQKCML